MVNLAIEIYRRLGYRWEDCTQEQRLENIAQLVASQPTPAQQRERLAHIRRVHSSAVADKIAHRAREITRSRERRP